MRQFKIKVPDDFAFNILKRLSTLDYTEEQVANVLGFFKKYHMEEHNVIISIVCLGLSEDEAATKYRLDSGYVHNIVTSFYWKVSRRLNSNWNLFIESSIEDMEDTEKTKAVYEEPPSNSMTLVRDMLDAGLIVSREYKAIVDAGYNSIDELRRDFHENRFELFQIRIRGLSSNSINNIIQLCMV